MEQEDFDKHVERIYKSLKKFSSVEARNVLKECSKRFPVRKITPKDVIIEAFPTDRAFAYAEVAKALGVPPTRVKTLALETGATEITRGVAQFLNGEPQLPEYEEEEEASEEGEEEAEEADEADEADEEDAAE